MKEKVLHIILLLLFVHTEAFSQCPFTPTVFPDDLILCPDSSDTLWTQEYDTYQWYHNGNPIPGETNPFLVVDTYNYAGSSVSVEVSQNGCTELSPSVLVDGWVFLLPVVQSTGTYTFDGSEFLVCTGDTLFFQFMLPYDTNIEWTENGLPIPGGTDPLLILTSSEVTFTNHYGVCGSPSICPDYIQCLGVDLPVRFISCTTGIEDEFPNSGVKLYPQPASDFVRLYGLDVSSDYFIADPPGRIVQTGWLDKEDPVISVSAFPPGIYYIFLSEYRDSAFRLIKL